MGMRVIMGGMVPDAAGCIPPRPRVSEFRGRPRRLDPVESDRGSLEVETEIGEMDQPEDGPPAPVRPEGDVGRERAVLLTLAAVQFTSIVDFMVVMPLGPQLMRTLG